MQLTIDIALLIIFTIVIAVIADCKMMIVMNANAVVNHVTITNIVNIVEV